MKKEKGFTFIELLIVVAIIGILASLLIPNVMVAIQKTKQKSAMGDIMFLATGCVDYVIDHGSWEGINQNGALTISGDFVQAVYPYRLKGLPITDTWGEPFNVYCGKEAVENSISGIPANEVGDDDFLILSYGRDHDPGPVNTIYDPSDPEGGIYTVTTLADFDEDLANWSGSWIIAPRVAKIEAGT